MKKAIKKKWLEALRSGEYDQGKFYLRDSDDNFCCLGVLCDLAAKDGAIPEPTVGDWKNRYIYGGTTTSLPEAVIDWAFTKHETRHKKYRLTDPKVDSTPLSFWNDHRDKNFTEIADLIEAEL